MRFAGMLLVSLSVFGQTLRVSPVTGSRGDEVNVEISLDSPASLAPSALQWEMIFPAQLLEVTRGGLEASRLARDSGKSLQCVERKAYSYACILAGERTPVPNGVIVTFHLKIRATAEAGTSALRIEKAEGATADLKRVAFPDAQAPVTVR